MELFFWRQTGGLLGQSGETLYHSGDVARACVVTLPETDVLSAFERGNSMEPDTSPREDQAALGMVRVC